MDNAKRPLHGTMQRSSFSDRLLSPPCSTDSLRKSFVPHAKRLLSSFLSVDLFLRATIHLNEGIGTSAVSQPADNEVLRKTSVNGDQSLVRTCPRVSR